VSASENIVALTDGEGWKITHAVFMDLLKTVKGLGEGGRNWMSGQLFMSEQRQLDLLVKTASERYAALLAKDPDLLEEIPLKYLASYLGVKDTSLSRIRKQISGK